MSGEKAPRKQSFLQGVAVLTAATIIVKLLGFIYKVPLQNILQERGYETENISLTYRWVVDDPLQAAGGGEKDGNRFELYRYADEETARRAYGQVVNLIAPEMESAARASHQITLTGGGSMFTVILDGVYYLALTRNSDVIYACSPDSLREANAILADIGYLHGKS